MTGPDKELAVVPAESNSRVENCVVISRYKIPTLFEIAGAAVRNQAYVDNSGDEAGDDQYMVQFPGCEQELLEQDAISARLRELISTFDKPDKFENVKVGDKLTRTYNHGNWEATVVEITEEKIVCEVIVDCPREMEFDRKTGINLLGPSYGYISK